MMQELSTFSEQVLRGRLCSGLSATCQNIPARDARDEDARERRANDERSERGRRSDGGRGRVRGGGG